MTKFGYARVSTTDQDLAVQLDALKRAGCDVVRAEKVTGTTTAGRVEHVHVHPGGQAIVGPVTHQGGGGRGLMRRRSAARLGFTFGCRGCSATSFSK